LGSRDIATRASMTDNGHAAINLNTHRHGFELAYMSCWRASFPRQVNTVEDAEGSETGNKMEFQSSACHRTCQLNERDSSKVILRLSTEELLRHGIGHVDIESPCEHTHTHHQKLCPTGTCCPDRNTISRPLSLQTVRRPLAHELETACTRPVARPGQARVMGKSTRQCTWPYPQQTLSQGGHTSLLTAKLFAKSCWGLALPGR